MSTSVLPNVKQYLSSNAVRIYRIACRVLPHLTARVYLLLGAGPVTLVDAGSGQEGSTQNILDGFEIVRREFGESVRIEDVQRVLLTHGHLDHVGGLPELLRRMDAQVGIHPLDSVWLSAGQEHGVLRRVQLARFFDHAGVPPESHETLMASQVGEGRSFSHVATDLPLEDGQRLDGLEIIHTPGHSPGHVCIAVGDMLLCGDHILSRTMPQQWPESIRPYTGLGHYLESLNKVRLRDELRVGLGGHEPVIDDLGQRIDEIARSQWRRLDRVVELLRRAERPLTTWETAQSIYGQSQGFYVFLTLMDTAARVEYLHQRGRLRIDNLDQIETDQRAPRRYRLAD